MTDGQVHPGGHPSRRLSEAQRRPVTALHGPSRAEMAVQRLGRAIQHGRLLPGQVLRLSDLAHRHGVKPAAFRLVLERLERDQLITIRGDTAVVNDLDWRSLRSIQDMWLGLEKTVLPTSLENLTPGELNHIEQFIDARGQAPGGADFIGHVIANDTRIVKALFAPTMRGVGAGVLDDMLNHTVRHHVFTQRYLNTRDSGLWSVLTQQQAETARLLRAGEYRLARSSQLTVSVVFRNLQLVAFDTPWARGTPDDHPEVGADWPDPHGDF